MIKITNLNKYYNRNKSNEIHVINNTSVEFEDKGLVCFLGPSGCGKTTLLNAIGGMDKTDSGQISYDGITLSKRNVDKFRAKEIGFIFQNYILFNDRTVYENLKLVLNMFKLTQTEIDERIKKALEAVNMANYERRLVRQLSGGQQQRIAIARALVKSPKLIIADEPTGNLDERNTTSIMNIIKKLSEECLVIMVTHEKRLAEFYASRIIELKDGKIISDIQNESKTALQTKDDVDIYLGDMEEVSLSDSDDFSIKYFYTNKKPELKVDIVYHNDTIYFRAKSNDPKVKFKYLSKNNEGVLLEGKRPELTLEDIKTVDYNMPYLAKDHVRNSVISFKEAMKSAFNYISKVRAKEKIKLIFFALAALMIVMSVGTFSKARFDNEYEFMNAGRDIVVLSPNGLSPTNIKQFEDDEKFVLPGGYFSVNAITFTLHTEETAKAHLNSFSALPSDTLQASQLICGEIPKNKYEIVLDKWVIDQYLQSENVISITHLSQAGFNDYSQLIDELLTFSVQIIYAKEDINIMWYNPENYDYSSYKIVGISNTNQPVCYLSYNDIKTELIKDAANNNYIPNYDYTLAEYYSFQSNIYSYGMLKDNGDLKLYSHLEKNENSLKQREVIVSKSYYDSIIAGGYTQNDSLYFLDYNTTFKVVGYSEELKNVEMIMHQDSIDELYFMILSKTSFSLLATDKEQLINKYASYNPVDIYDLKLSAYREQKATVTIIFLIFTAIFLSASSLFLYFTIRSSLIPRIYEVGVYRSVGVRKNDIVRLFLCEIIVILFCSSFVGYLLGGFIIKKYLITSIYSIFMYEWYSWLISLALIVGINVSVGLIPIMQLLRLTPYQIITKYDM